jgi:LDH2 family malate/lactate/ureidoglycolate dehydrogenase
VKTDAGHLQALCRDILGAQGVGADDALIVGDVLIEANLRGHDSHGVVRIPQWVKGLKAGAINAKCAPKVLRETAATALIDGDLGLGPVVAMVALECAAGKAREAGIGMVSVRRASHIGMLQFYTRHLAARGLIGMAMTNTESGVAPFGGIDPVLGTNPVSCAVPAPGAPIVLDMSTSVVARGKIVLARNRGEKIPEGWAIDAEGAPTTDPTAALAGALLPAGGAKGSGLAIIVDALTGALAGAEVGLSVTGTLVMDQEGSKGDFFLAIDPGAVGERDAFLALTGKLGDDVRASRPAPGADKVMAPGEPEDACRQRRLAEGIPIDDDLFVELEELAAGLPSP